MIQFLHAIGLTNLTDEQVAQYQLIRSGHGSSLRVAGKPSKESRAESAIRRRLQERGIRADKKTIADLAQVAESLSKGLDRLDIQDRRILRMRVDERKSNEQIAKELHLAPSVTRASLERATSQLSEAISGFEDGFDSMAARTDSLD